jgi:hypothetical protein
MRGAAAGPCVGYQGQLCRANRWQAEAAVSAETVKLITQAGNLTLLYRTARVAEPQKRVFCRIAAERKPMKP